MKRALTVIFVSQFAMLIVEAQSQTLADYARQERARQKPSASKVYTNDDIAAIVGVRPASAEAAPEPPAQPVAETPAAVTDSRGRDEKYWRAAFTEARSALKRAEDRILVLENRRNDLNLRMLRQSDLYNRENVLRLELNASDADLAAARREADAARTGIATLEEDLRRSNGLPGWAR
jgi:hypothetical protein